MLLRIPAVVVAFALGAGSSPSDELTAAAKGLKFGSTEAAVRAELAALGVPRSAYSRCALGSCEDAAAESATQMGLIWSRGEGRALSMLYVGFCRRLGRWLAEDVTTYAPGLGRRLTGSGDWTETFTSRGKGVCDVPLLEQYVEVARALSIGASPDSVEPTTIRLGRPDGVTFSRCSYAGCTPTAEREATMMAIRWGRESEGLQAELTLIFCGAVVNWELSSVHINTRPSGAGAFGTERPVREVYRVPKVKKTLVRCLERS